MTEEEKLGFQKRKAAIEKKISAITNGKVEHDDQSIANLYFQLGTVNDALIDYDEAIRCYNEALSYMNHCFEEFDPLEDALYECLKEIYEKKEDYQNAIKYALKSSKNTMEYHLSDAEGSFNYILELYYLHLKAGDYSTAKIYLDRAAGFEYSDEEIENKTAILDYWYFVYYYAINDVKNALTYGEKAYTEIVDAFGTDIEQAQYVKAELENLKNENILPI